MVARNFVAGMACGILVTVGIALFGHGALTQDGFYHGLRYMIAGSGLVLIGGMYGAVLALAHRTRTLTRVYREGYRHGRRDANAALFEEGATLLGVVEPEEKEHNGNGG